MAVQSGTGGASEPSAGRPGPAAARARTPDNAEIAEVLDEIAALLDARRSGDDVHRARAYREGARSLRELDRSAAEIAREGGVRALAELPAIGKGLGRVIESYVHTGRVEVLERLAGGSAPEGLFATIPGIGPELAERIHERLGVESLEALEVAAHDGRLEDVPGIGPRRARGVREALGGMLRRSTRRRARARQGRPREVARPPVALLLEIDAAYREKAAAGELKKIAPRRFNPEGEAWLPVWRTERDGWRFEVLFSNTAVAHELGRTRDWVVIYYARGGEEGQCTVVSETRGAREGERVVRGRERESA